jgi:hypothetical protein
MPSKAAQLIAFFAVLLISVALHRYVYRNLIRLLLRDYPKRGRRLAGIARTLFIVMDSPFLFLFVRSHIHAELATVTRVLLYPFSVWQAVMLMWAIVLVPFSLWRRRKRVTVAIPGMARKLLRKSGWTVEEEESYEPELEIAGDSV